MERVRKADGTSGHPLEGVRLTLLAGDERMNAQWFEIEPGIEVPEHSHPNEQVGVVLGGRLTFLVDGDRIECGPGDSYAIPGGEPHAARNNGAETVEGVEMFSPPRDDPTWESE